MRPAAVTRTINPLPFEHLEPKRFEDLVRQLAYDFKPWRQLEATGRSGSDDGFDARGFEITDSSDRAAEQADAEEEASPETTSDRLWLIQCKREKVIGPAQMRKHLAAIPAESVDGLYGIVFAAACDFSKATRDVLRQWARDNSLSECVIWGKAELEDLLFLPKNDGLLFAYFGISLRIRRQKVSTEIRREVTLKRKLQKLFPDTEGYGTPLLLRDPSDARYPFVKGESLKADKCLWLPRQSLGIGLFGLRIIIRQFWAFYDYETRKWDIASAVDFSIPSEQDNLWHDVQVAPDHSEKTREIVDFWSMLPKSQQFFMKIVGYIPYSDIIEIDDVGNNYMKIPTVFAQFKDNSVPYARQSKIYLNGSSLYGTEGEFDASKHAVVFPDNLRDRSWEEAFFADWEITRALEPHPVTLTEPDWKRKLREERAAESGGEAL
jgi:hypothetical protein